MPEFYILKSLITLNFGGNNTNTVGVGERNRGVIVMPKTLKAKGSPKALRLKQLKFFKRRKI